MAENNHIHHYSRLVRTYFPGVAVDGVGNQVRHNLFHDAPHNAVQLAGNEHVIEFNEFHHVCLETDDVGAFRAATGRSAATSCGTTTSITLANREAVSA